MHWRQAHLLFMEHRPIQTKQTKTFLIGLFGRQSLVTSAEEAIVFGLGLAARVDALGRFFNFRRLFQRDAQALGSHGRSSRLATFIPFFKKILVSNEHFNDIWMRNYLVDFFLISSSQAISPQKGARMRFLLSSAGIKSSKLWIVWFSNSFEALKIMFHV